MRRARLLIACFAAALLNLAPPAPAQAATQAERPRVGLVLGGGGARGAAHIGVLEALERHRVRIDCVAATSMGALVAGAWAAGVSPADMRAAMQGAQWNDMFQDNPGYTELNLRYKRLLERYVPGSEAGLDAAGVTYPPGAVAGQKIKLFINQLVRADRIEPDLGALALPVAILATDIGSGERVVFHTGSLTQAMRASMAVPGLLAPAEVDGRKLVDGGLVDNLPIDEVRALCQPDVVIAVNVGSPLLPAADVDSLLTVSAQMVALLTEQNVQLSLKALRPGDIYIRPALDGIRAGDFGRHADAARSGQAAAEAVAPALQALALDEDRWAHWLLALRGVDRVPPRVDEIRIEGLTLADTAVVRRHVGQRTGQPLETGRLNRDLLRVYGDGWYQSVDYNLLTTRERNVLRIAPVEKSWGPDYLRLAVNLDSTLSEGSTYSLRAAVQRTWINRLGGELLFSAEIGSRSALEFEWHQPLDAAQGWFGEVDLGTGWSFRDLYDDGQRISRFQIFQSSAEFALGRNLGLLGELRAGWRETVTRAALETGQLIFPAHAQYFGGATLSLELDQMNRLYFPTDGWAAQLRYFHSRRGDYARLGAELRGAFSLGDWVLGARAHYTGSTRGLLPPAEAGSLGGFLNLSGFARGQLVADRLAYGHLRAERIVGRAPLGLRGDLRLGLALEVARVSRPFTETRLTGLLDSATLYFGGETPFGPVYLGFGHSTSGSTNAYLFLGTP